MSAGTLKNKGCDAVPKKKRHYDKKDPGQLYTRFSGTELKAKRLIKQNGRSKTNPDGFTGGEQVVLDTLFGLSRKKGYTFASNTTIGKMLSRSERSIESTIARLRKRGHVLQFQRGSSYSIAYRVLVLDLELRQAVIAQYGEPSAENGYWNIILRDGVEIPNRKSLLSAGRPAKCDVDCSGLINQTEEKLPTSSGEEGSDHFSLAGNEAEISVVNNVSTVADLEPAPGEFVFEVNDREMPAYIHSSDDVTDPASIPDRVGRDEWAGYVCGTVEYRIFSCLYTHRWLSKQPKFLRALGRAIRRGKFKARPNMLNWLRNLVNQPPDNYDGSVMMQNDLLKRVEFLSNGYCEEAGYCTYEKIKGELDKLERSVEQAVADAGEFMAQQANFGPGSRGYAMTHVLDYKYPSWGKTLSDWVPEPTLHLTDQDARIALYQGCEKSWKEWYNFMSVIEKNPDLLVHYKQEGWLREELTDSLIYDGGADLIEYFDTLLQLSGHGQLSDYTVLSVEEMSTAREDHIKHLTKLKLEVFSTNQVGNYMRKNKVTEDAYAA